MANASKIQWCDATWNCLAGCEAVSPGCAHCYAATMTRRLEAMGQKDYAGLTTAKHFNGTVRCLPHKLDIPLKRRKPTTYFVNSMSDLFHEDVPDEFIDKVFCVMALASMHTFQVLTKRAERMSDYCCQLRDGKRNLGRQLESLGWDCIAGRFAVAIAYGVAPCSGQDGKPPWKPFPNVWLGVSCEDQQRADERIPHLVMTPAAVRFLSCEPLLGEIDLTHINTHSGAVHCLWSAMHNPERPAPWSRIDWVIAGGESGGGARPCNVEWIRSIIQQCKVSGVPCFVKQLGSVPCWDLNAISNGFACASRASMNSVGGFKPLLEDKKGGNPSEWPHDLRVRQIPPKIIQGTLLESLSPEAESEDVA